MDFLPEAYRAMILYKYKRGLILKKFHDYLQAALEEFAPALATVSY